MQFLSCGTKPLGVYPIVDRAYKLEPLYQCGVTTAQLRIKDLKGDALENEVKKAVELSRAYDVRFFLNDYWSLAIAYGAYGVHLGQEDIQQADIEAIHAAGLRLGISSHTPEEIRIALGFHPSYLAIGPVFEPISKKMAYDNVGIERLKAWAAYTDYPIVAIGGITQENIAEVARTGAASGLAMISAVLDGAGEISTEKTRALIDAYTKARP
jgi:thiamine-phosphate pyrophosphorylase/hydroxymethylpyrimidine kinase/phosphomethylpyrimidine kinase/thiamine-phosphate diphosphorylase